MNSSSCFSTANPMPANRDLIVAHTPTVPNNLYWNHLRQISSLVCTYHKYQELNRFVNVASGQITNQKGVTEKQRNVCFCFTRGSDFGDRGFIFVFLCNEKIEEVKRMWVFVDIEGKAYWCFLALACYACRYCSRFASKRSERSR